MSGPSSIEWTDCTWNPVRGCTRVSQGCVHCYAETLAARFSKPGQWGHGLAVRHALPGGGTEGRWTGVVQPAPAHVLAWPLTYKGHPRARAEGRRTRIFVNSTSDLFHESLPDAEIDKVFAVMALCPQFDFQVLTKRAARMRAYVNTPARAETVWEAVTALVDQWDDGKLKVRLPTIADSPLLYALAAAGAAWGGQRPWPLPNVWLGVSTEDQATADERIPELLATPAAIHFISAEPLLGQIDLEFVPWPIDRPTFPESDDISDGRSPLHMVEGSRIDWAIPGGESGPGARPMHPDWPRLIRDQCAAAGVAFFFKQWGAWRCDYDRERDDPDWRACSNQQDAAPRGRWLNLAGGTGFHGERVHYATPTSKHAAGALLDGVEHKAFPPTPLIPAQAATQVC